MSRPPLTLPGRPVLTLTIGGIRSLPPTRLHPKLTRVEHRPAHPGLATVIPLPRVIPLPVPEPEPDPDAA